ncbi:IS1182 family transposase [Hymenobacter sp. GOD-10R]|uniref:IS1182 family transposase n=1 Tax=Hymenobacter sp. GOD-10R TaxID=3093922 RepID=UPI002D78B99D|nr:IS1182 family transposase [Hymenobacter sp. GOD-10R]WRQ28118.1 IS1182 family transposase [Hymenobacter sp. GOD-10R]WRQ31121.1 IS1182 family transposase [Hymenobacter sp. GOD-10R]WRQ31872.1 IS1182 family transposase [Hymenobacter sp. GOD-10R]WRQ31908.1 IS1182 family transposase [Hymenobacter sp. GOD-10R]
MQGKKQFTDQLVTHFRLSERVPTHNFYRRLDALLDLGFLYEATQGLYSHTGQPSLDPVVFFKLVLIGYLENITSDRRLLEHCAMRLDLLYFLGYELDEALPWHSTVSRTRQLYPAALFEQLFDRVFSLCVQHGLVAGDTQTVDSALVKANASLDSLCEKQPVQAVWPTLTIVGSTPKTPATPHPASIRSAPAHQLRYEAARQAKRQQEPGSLGATRPQARLLSNKTHYSPTDPEARISIKPGKARALNYLCSLVVDTAQGVISHVQANLADSRDSLHLPRIVQHLQQRLTANDLQLRDLVADTGYSNGFNYALLENSGVTPWIPVFGAYKPIVEGFTYHARVDEYRCRADKPLPFRKYRSTADGNWMKHYRAFYQDCQHCPFKASCVPYADHKQLNRSAFDAAYHRAWHRQRSRQGQHMRRVRQRTIEPVFGNLLHHYGLRRINVRGQAGAHKCMLLAAVAYNLKKLLRHQPKLQLGMARVLPLLPPAPPFMLRCRQRHRRNRTKALRNLAGSNGR